MRLLRLCSVLLLAIATYGCSGPTLVPTPNLYRNAAENPFHDVPAELQTNSVLVLYATDRQSDPNLMTTRYTALRSRQWAYGLCTVTLGDGSSWDELVQASCTSKRPRQLPVKVGEIQERGHYPALPPVRMIDGQWQEDPDYLENVAQATRRFHQLLAEQLAKTPRKEVFVFVHGYNNTFDDAVLRLAQIWHFLGRVGVPVVYSWPAGSGGLLRGYTHDRESGEFTNAHLKAFLRTLASCADVQKIHLIAHSRGTDVLTTALRELHIECRAAGDDMRAAFKLGQLVLAAPDIDLEVFVERFSSDRTGLVPEQITMYVSPDDKVIGISGWLFHSIRRIGQLAPGDLRPDMAVALADHPVLSVVDVQAKTNLDRHGYFSSHPAVLSDLILVLRDHRSPGAPHGRPLLKDGAFWVLPDQYPYQNTP